ncbi:MAG TPA: cysteine desulfurase family protein [Candidatus Sulfotelmatobacter sp.]|nr:cysteine desulfurase family protein [Candidatus Sulfotelmatobacter sp.]
MSAREVYADYAATTRTAPEVLDAMRPWFEAGFGNPSSVHRRGEAAREAIEAARRQVAGLIGASPEEIVFTASGSEANNLALQGVLGSARGERRRLVTSAIEHPSVLETARALESRGTPVTIVPVDERGRVRLDRLAASLGPDVALVSVMWANNEVGTLQPVEEIAELARGAGARFHTDAVQAAGKLTINVETLGVDLLSLAGHKFEGPPGAAALYVRRRTRLIPLIHGGHQERSRRAGTENLPAIVGLGVAAERAARQMASGEPERVRALADQLLDGLLQRIPGAVLNGPRESRAPGIVNLRFPGVDGEALLHALDEQGVTVSTGSACSAASPGPSHVLIAMGLTPEQAHASVRFSLGPGSIESDVQHILAVTPPAIERLRALADSPARRSA